MGGSNTPEHWLLPDIKLEKEEEEEESISQRGDLLDFTDQDSVKREEPDSPSATRDKQVSVHDVTVMLIGFQCCESLGHTGGDLSGSLGNSMGPQ